MNDERLKQYLSIDLLQPQTRRVRLRSLAIEVQPQLANSPETLNKVVLLMELAFKLGVAFTHIIKS